MKTFAFRNLTILLLFLGTYTFASASSQKIFIGDYKSRAIWTPTVTSKPSTKAPVVILIPGSGPNGPEEMMPSALTVDNKDHSIFDAFSEPFSRAGIHTLALGKPGVEFHSGWDPEHYFYDKNLYSNLKWVDLIKNVQAAVDFVRAQPGVDQNRVYILGHSEGTQVAIDYASEDPKIKGLLLLGFMDNDMATASSSVDRYYRWPS